MFRSCIPRNRTKRRKSIAWCSYSVLRVLLDLECETHFASFSRPRRSAQAPACCHGAHSPKPSAEPSEPATNAAMSRARHRFRPLRSVSKNWSERDSNSRPRRDGGLNATPWTARPSDHGARKDARIDVLIICLQPLAFFEIKNEQMFRLAIG